MRPVGSKYLLEQPLGRGATGTVWRARQRETAGAEAAVAGQPGETVAIKVLKEELANDADVVMRFLRERSVLLRLTHPNIVRTRDLVVEGDVLALVMDLVDGPDLHRYIRENGPLTPVGAALLMAQVADALAASHADGVVHRDLKPANVLLAERDGQMHPMLTDFGIARLADSPGLTRTHEFVGTPAYVAPESAEGRPQTSAVDVYGAGIMLYELLTGRPPFAGGTALEVLHQHLSAEPRRPSTVPGPLWTVVERCLSKDPDRRPSAENLARGLRVVADGIGVHASAAQIEAAEGVGALLAPDPAPAPVPGSATPGLADAAGAAGRPARPTRRRCSRTPPPAPRAPPVRSGRRHQLPARRRPGRSPAAGRGRRHRGDAARAARPGRAAAAGAAPVADPAARGARPQRADPDPVPRPRRGPAAPPPPATPAAAAAAAARAVPAAAPAVRPAPAARPAAAVRPAGLRPAAAAAAAPVRPAAPAVRAPAPAALCAAAPAAPAEAAAGPPAPAARAAAGAAAARPAEPREPRRRSANPMRIPGLGCLKGCLFTILVFVLAGWLIWELTPLQDWIAQGKSYWDAIGDAVSTVTDWIGELGSATDTGGTTAP